MRFLLALFLLTHAHLTLAALPIQHWQTPAGVRVYFVESRSLPILDVSVDFAAGSSADTAEKSGRAALTQHMLSLGAGGLSEDDISRAIADVGAQFGGRFDADRAGLSLRTLSSLRERKQALDILAKTLQQPEFPSIILEREKARVIAGIKEGDTKPANIADRALAKMLYGDHPYGLRSNGEIASVGALQREDLLDFYKTRYTATNAVVAIMGDVSRAEAEVIAVALTQQLPESTAGKAAAPPPQVLAPLAATRKIAHPASQAHIQLAYPGISRTDPDYFPLHVGNYILGGGGFVSRLMEEVRQKRGLAYSVSSYFMPLWAQGPFEINLQTRKEQADEALALVQKTLADFIAQGPTEKELVAAKQNIIGGFPLRIDSNRKIVDYLALIGFYKLPLTYLDDYVIAVDKITVAQIKEAWQRRIKPEGMVTVVVGAEEK